MDPRAGPKPQGIGFKAEGLQGSGLKIQRLRCGALGFEG